MFEDLKIRTKLVLLVAGPLVIVLLLAALGARSRLSSAADSKQVSSLVSVARADSDVVDALQQEAVYTSAFIGSDRERWEGELAKARKGTDVVLKVALDRLEGDGGSTPGYRSTMSLAIDAAGKLPYIRETVDQGYRWEQAATTYTQLQQTFLSVNSSIADAIEDPQAGAQLRTTTALASYKASLAHQGALVTGAAEAGGFDTPAAYQLLTSSVTRESGQADIFGSVAAKGPRQSVLDIQATGAFTRLESARDQAVLAGEGGRFSAKGEAPTRNTSAVVKDLHTVETGLFERLIDDSRATSASAERAANLFLVAALVAMIGAAAAALLLGRQITRPLKRLTIAANHLSNDQMPALIDSLKNPSEEELGFQIAALRPIEIDSNDEIGRLARSFNEVQRVAGEVAAEQATLLRKGIGEMFVNLARRNQALLDRQIEFIDDLERGEEDPDQLDNLYKLDHLATRMRRNAESLLVLAGAEPPRRRGRPAPLANVVRAALAEVEDFGRIDLLSFDEVLVASNAAADLAHLLSELMENATNYSPPETKVEVVGHRTKADGYVISITDHGIGMSADQVTEANESLAKPPLVGLAMSRSLGFIVVGRLAARHGIAVRMMPSASGGVTAVASLAPSLVVDTPGGMAAADSPVAPARLKSVLDRQASVAAAEEVASAPTSVPPIQFTPFGESAPAPILEPVAWQTGPTPSAASATGPTGLPTRNGATNGSTNGSTNGGPAPIAWGAPERGGTDMPEALPDAPASGGSTSATVDATARLDGPPPAPPQHNRPFFLEDAEPRGRSDRARPRPPPAAGRRRPRRPTSLPLPACSADPHRPRLRRPMPPPRHRRLLRRPSHRPSRRCRHGRNPG